MRLKLTAFCPQNAAWFIFGTLLASAIAIGSGLSIGENCSFTNNLNSFNRVTDLMNQGWTVTRVSDVGNGDLICLHRTVLGAIFP